MCIMSQNAHVYYTCGHSYILKNNPSKHGFIYKNEVKIPGKCSMILPIPTPDVSTIKLIDTTAYAEMMNEFLINNMSRGLSSVSLQVGMYTLILGRDIQAMHDELGLFIEPKLANWLLNHYKEDEFTFITCVWEGEMNAQPIQIEYQPTWPNHLFFPTMEAHGDIPTEGLTNRCHFITVSTGEESSKKFLNAPETMYNSYSGEVFNYSLPNGDMYLHIESIETIWDSDLSNINFIANPN